MLIKVISGVLVLIAVFMGLKQGWAMLSNQPAMSKLLGPIEFRTRHPGSQQGVKNPLT